MPEPLETTEMTDSPDPATVWREFCSRIAEAGAAVLGDPTAAGSRNLAEGLRCLSRQLVFAVQDAVEFRDADFPALHRFDDDVTKWGGTNTDNNYLRCSIDPACLYRVLGLSVRIGTARHAGRGGTRRRSWPRRWR